MTSFRSSSRVMFIIVICCIFAPTMFSFAQGPSRAQVLQAQNYFISRNLLPQLVTLTQDDSEQATRFSNVIVACYQIFREMDRFERSRPSTPPDLSQIQSRLGELQNQLTAIRKEIPDSNTLTENITNAVLLKIGDYPATRDDKELNALRNKVEQLEQDMLDNKAKVTENQENTRNMKLISIAGAIFTGIIAILAAL